MSTLTEGKGKNAETRKASRCSRHPLPPPPPPPTPPPRLDLDLLWYSSGDLYFTWKRRRRRKVASSLLESSPQRKNKERKEI
ncbi:hypothetical protein E2C01_097594 [Portunus trituberculatus]|uniref:Uncharacterized protein n=1 Tax=Portunus trituberculatus TaxID=210409 RepID=A0A5B7KAD0_PORTR|nr:hypothetical protein [Portunus trituberculatus]